MSELTPYQRLRAHAGRLELRVTDLESQNRQQQQEIERLTTERDMARAVAREVNDIPKPEMPGSYEYHERLRKNHPWLYGKYYPWPIEEVSDE